MGLASIISIVLTAASISFVILFLMIFWVLRN
ncbi:hypothetical protein QBD00_003509 [Ochrobactrum sp. AN78]|nr:hypothetical protein [Ochrobactrum sp. AN78]